MLSGKNDNSLELSGQFFSLGYCLMVEKNWNEQPVIAQAAKIYWACSKQYTLEAWEQITSCRSGPILFLYPLFVSLIPSLEQVPGVWLATPSAKRRLHQCMLDWLHRRPTREGGVLTYQRFPLRSMISSSCRVFFFFFLAASSDGLLGPCFPILTS